jgi:hypothetical protein
MKSIARIVTGIILIGAAHVSAMGAGNRQPPGGQGQDSGRALTADQAAKVKEILSAYDPDNLTAETAKAINEAFRQAGIRPGPGMKEAIEAAGFDADKLRQLAPPPQGGPDSEDGDR